MAQGGVLVFHFLFRSVCTVLMFLNKYKTCLEMYTDMIDHDSYIHNLAVLQLIRGIQTHDLCYICAVLYQVTSHAS